MGRILEALRRLAGNGRADRALSALAQVVEGAADAVEARERIIRGAAQGDLDHLIELAMEADRKRKAWKGST